MTSTIAPSAKTVTGSSIEVNPVTISGANPGGQIVEYAISTSADTPSSGWQEGAYFGGLEAETDYWLFARSKEKANYAAGAAQRSAAAVTTGGLSVLETITAQTAKSGEVLIHIRADNVTIDWGDGTVETKGNMEWTFASHTYASATEHTITITGDNFILFWFFNEGLTAVDVSGCLSLESLSVNGNQLTSLDISANTKLAGLYIQKNNLDKDALDAIFNALPTYTLPDVGYLWFEDNPGTATCNRALYEAKGWVPD